MQAVHVDEAGVQLGEIADVTITRAHANSLAGRPEISHAPTGARAVETAEEVHA